MSGKEGSDAAVEGTRLAGELAFAITEAASLDDALLLAVRRLCEVTGAAIGQAWVSFGMELECSSAWHAPFEGMRRFREASESINFQANECLPGQVWATRRPVWMEDVTAEAGFRRTEAARKAGLGAGMGIPVVSRDEVFCVLEFLLAEPRAEDRHVIELGLAAATLVGSLIERKRSEDELRRSESRYRLLAENSSDVISVTDSHGVLRYVSPASRMLTGYEPNELIGRSGYEFIHPDDLNQVVNAHIALLDTPRTIITPPYRTRRKDGSYVWIESTVRPIRDPETGDIVEIQAAARDITQRQRVELALEQAYTELEHANERLEHTNQQLGRANAELGRSNVELEQFAYDASHDLGEPLRMMAQLAGELAGQYGSTFDERGEQLCTSIIDGVDRMQTLISDLLEYSRVSSDPLHIEPVDCGKVLEETLELLSETIEDKQVTVIAEPLPRVMAHRSQLGQLFQNLLSNALKFAREGAPLEVYVSAGREDAAWRFSVRDNGIGIDSHNADRVFEMFRRLHARDAYAGTGMGLSICKRIVERHGGRIWVESAPGGGSVFRFTIPDAS